MLPSVRYNYCDNIILLPRAGLFSEVTIGFLDPSYTFPEAIESAQLVVGVTSGSLDTEIVVNLTTVDDSAVGMYCKHNSLPDYFRFVLLQHLTIILLKVNCIHLTLCVPK